LLINKWNFYRKIKSKKLNSKFKSNKIYAST
jgi:hypothetical protein